MKRIEKTLKNSIYALGAYLFTAALTLLIRKVFLQTLPLDLLGYEGLFGNVFAIISLAELGIESLILYRLFPAFARNDKEEINHIVAVYKTLYKYIGLTVLALGILLIPFLHLIIRQEGIDWSYVYLIYGIQLAGTLCTYFLAYKRIVYNVSQQEYECTKTDTAVSTIFNFAKLAVLLLLKSYTLYLLCGLMAGLISNIIISRKVDRKFGFLNLKEKVTLADIKKLDLGKELKCSTIQKVCFAIYGSTDNVLVTYLFGLDMTGLLSNYILIYTYVTNFLTRLIRPFQMSIGNFIYSNDIEQGRRTFRMFDFISFCLACYICTCYYNLFNPSITLFFGEKYLLSTGFVAAFVANQYIMWNHQFLTYYRNSFGKYELDTLPFFIAAVLNIVLSIVLGKWMGIAGVMIGTVVGHMGIWIGRTKVVFSEYLKTGLAEYIGRQLIRAAVCFGLLSLTGLCCKNLAADIGGMILRILICAALCSAVLLVLFFRTEEMKDVFRYMKTTLSIVAQKRKRQEQP